MTTGQDAFAPGVTGGTSTGTTGRSSRSDGVLPSISAAPLCCEWSVSSPVSSPVSEPPRTLLRTSSATTTGTSTAVAISAMRRSGSCGAGVGSGGPSSVAAVASSVLSPVSATSEVDDRTGQRSGDPVDGLHPRDDQAAEVVDGLCLGADDHVVGAGDVLGLGHAVDLGPGRGDLGGLAAFGLDEDVGVDHGRPFI